MILDLGVKPYYSTARGDLYNADCLDILPLIPDKSVDLCLTDPPYGIGFLSHRTDNHTEIQNDRLGEWTEQLPLWLKEFNRVTSDTACCCCCSGGGKTPVTALFTIEFIKHFNLIQTLIWDKMTIGLGWRYRPSYETILVGSKSKDKYNWFTDRKNVSNIIKCNNEIPKNGEHPTPKPYKLMAELLKLHSKESMLVLEPFAGGGATLEACESHNRRWIGIEISEKYCELSAKRIDQFLSQGKLF